VNTDRLISQRVACVPPSGIRKFFDIASTMKGAISLGVGEPDFVTPWNIRDAAIASIERGRTHYTGNSGIEELRKLIVEYLEVRFDVRYDWKNVLVTVGASEALDLVFRAIIDPGDEILIPAPSYVSYIPGVTFAGGTGVAVDTYEKDNFALTPEAIEKAITPKTKAILFPYPNNPTGAVMTREQIDLILPVILKHDLLIIADEIYAELTYGHRHQSIARGMEPRTVLINGFSKSFAMTGWRLGYAAGPEPIIKAMTKIHQYSMLCAGITSQDAGIEALRYELQTDFRQVRDMRQSYNRRRAYVVKRLNDMGLQCFEPRGAFYAFPNIKNTGLTSDEFCEKFLLQEKVACAPGSAFGPGGEGYVRCSYAASMDNLKIAFDRMERFLGTL